jgi:hypothetical protein
MSRSSRRKKRSRAKNFKIYLLISGLCFFVALVISFTIGKLPSFIDKTVSAQIQRGISEEMGKGGMDLEKMKKEFKKRGGR